MTLMAIVKQAEKLAADHSPQILAGVAVAGTVTTAILTGKATIKACKIVNVHRYDQDPSAEVFITNKQIVEKTWKLYIPALASGVLTVATIITATQIGTRRTAALAAAYAVSEKAFVEYKEKVVEKIGEAKERSVRDDIAQDRVRETPMEEPDLFVAGGGKVLCFEPGTARYFMSDMETLKKAQNDLNYQVLNNLYASLSDFYDLIGLERTKFSDDMGWNSDRLLELKFSTVLADDKPCLVMDYHVVPLHGYSSAH